MKLLLGASMLGAILSVVAFFDARLEVSSAPAWQRFQEQCRADQIPISECRQLFWRTSP
jgi:hypothetical protein